jgi:predicted glycosyltransferase involved in capsule biosynthesis
MKNLSFVIGVKIDSQDRLNNLKISVDNLQHNLPDSEIIISEFDIDSKIGNSIKNVKHVFVKTENFFNRQKSVNYGISNSDRDIVVHYDADIILNKTIVERCVDLLLTNQLDVVYPHNGYFYDIPKEYHYEIYNNKNLNNILKENCKLLSTQNVGGAVFFNRNIFWQGGGANEKFLGVGYEDNEIYERYKKLGYKIGRVNAPIFHLNHERKETSFDYNPYNKINLQELTRIRSMNKSELLEEVKTWNYKV